MADPNLQIRGGGGSYPDPEKRAGAGLKKKNFRAPSGPSLVYK